MFDKMMVRPLSSICIGTEQGWCLSIAARDHSGYRLSTDFYVTLHQDNPCTAFDCPAVFHFQDTTNPFQSLYFNERRGDVKILFLYLIQSYDSLCRHIPFSYLGLIILQATLFQICPAAPLTVYLPNVQVSITIWTYASVKTQKLLFLIVTLNFCIEIVLYD